MLILLRFVVRSTLNKETRFNCVKEFDSLILLGKCSAGKRSLFPLIAQLNYRLTVELAALTLPAASLASTRMA